MKIPKSYILSLCGGLGLLATAAAQPAPAPTNEPSAVRTNAVVPPDQAPPGPTPTPLPENQAPPPNPPPTNAAPAEPSSSGQLWPAPSGPTVVGTNGANELRLNFRNAPLEMVLNYFSDAAGFIILPETEVRGKVDVWSNQPVSKDEAVELLNTILSKNGYALLRNGRTLTLVSREEAKKRDIPVKSGSDPEKIPKDDQIVTQILPIRFINASQVTRDLQPLLPEKAQMSANEAGNALVITDTQASIRRMAEIIKALDTPLSSVSTVKVFPLKFADAKSLATVIKDLFAPQQDSSRNNDPRARFMNFMRGGRDGGGPPGMGGPGGDSSGGGRAPTPRVVAVAEERSNALVVSAPQDQMALVEEVVQQVDTDIDSETELRVFRLKYADPQEMADLLTNLFPDPTMQNSRNQFGGGRFARFFGGGGGQNSSASQSSRQQSQTRVLAVPDLRTGSVVVSAARDLMEQIARMVEELDADPAKKQKVFVYSLENTDPQAVQELLQSLFPAQTSGGYGSYGNNRMNNNNRGAGSQLNNRATQMQNQGYGRSSSGFNNSFGSGIGGSTIGR